MRTSGSVLLGLLLSLGSLSTGLLAPVPAYAKPIEGYASYQAPKKCHPKPRPGTKVLGRWVAANFGGGYIGTARACRKKDGPTSEHQTGRAFDWSVNAARKADRKRVQRLLRTLFAADKRGNEHAKARRMGVMYLIWNDRMYAAWRGFEPTPYLSSSCRSRKKCSPTLRHRDHVHVSLSRAGARGKTSWYAGRLR